MTCRMKTPVLYKTGPAVRGFTSTRETVSDSPSTYWRPTLSGAAFPTTMFHRDIVEI